MIINLLIVVCDFVGQRKEVFGDWSQAWWLSLAYHTNFHSQGIFLYLTCHLLFFILLILIFYLMLQC